MLNYALKNFVKKVDFILSVLTSIKKKSLSKIKIREFPGGPVVRSPSFHCQGLRFDPWSGN